MKIKFTQFRWLVAMLLPVTAMAMPKMAWAETYDQNGFAKDGSYQPATLTTDQYDINGDGTIDEVYEIGNAGQLYWFAALVNGKLTDGTSQNRNACAVLVSNITVNKNLLNSLDNNGYPTGTVTIDSWTPFGDYISSYYDGLDYLGIFDGNGHSISGLYCKQPNAKNISFCGYMTKGTIKNVAIIDSYFEGDYNVGGIVGASNESAIKNCLFCGTVKSNKRVGGICGAIQGYSTISDCFSNAQILVVENANNYCGGICGMGYGQKIKLRNCVYNNSLYSGQVIKWVEEYENDVTWTGTVEHITGMKTAEIASGKATHWLNRYHSGDGLGWYQNIDNGQTNDAYPVLDNTHGMVYASQPCPSNYSNDKTKLSKSLHSWDTDNVCKQCGKTKDVFDLVTGFQEPSQVDGVYQIRTAGELYWFTALVNGNGLLTDGTPPNNSANAVLTSDITVNTNVLDESGNLGEKSDTHLDWIPIGNSDRPYTGTFNGQGHTISGLFFNNSSKAYVGLFGYVRNGKIQNTGIVDSYFKGNYNVGGLCGLASNGSISYCYNTGAVSGSSNVGGVCGWTSNSSISYCYNTGAVSGSSSVGGVCGLNHGAISNCYFDNNKCNYNAVVDGYGTVTNTLGKTTEEFASGEVCYLLNGSRSTGTTENPLVWYQNLSEGGDACPVLKRTGNNTVYLNNHYSCSCEPGNPTTCYTNDNQDIYDPHSWENGFCAKNSSVCQPAEQNTDGVYEISNAGQLYWYAKLINDNDNIYACAVLTNDITDNEGDVAGCNGAKKDTWRQWEVICNSSYYHGTFDGQCHTISGLFGYGFIGKNEGTIKNLIISNSYLFKYYFTKGGICNENYGTISRCTFSGTLVGQADLMGATDKYYIGGICGLNQNIIEDCYVKDNIQFSTATPNSNNKLYVGGISGGNAVYGKIENCYNMANITCQTTVNTPFIKSGICGWNTDNAVTTNCYYLTGTADYGIGETVDVKGSVEAVSSEKFASGEVTYLLNAGKAFGSQAWGQQLGTDDYPVLSDYKVIKAAKGDKDANNNDTYWATFSNLNSDATLLVPSARNLNVYNATVSSGTMTLKKRTDNQVAKGEGVLLKTDGEYVNVKANETNGLTKVEYANNNLVATPATEKTITADEDSTLYRLTYNDVSTQNKLGFYLSLVKDEDDKVDETSLGKKLKATPGKAYLKVSTEAATTPATAALARSFVFPGDDETTGIGEIVIEGDAGISGSANANGRIYNLQGQQVTAPVKGLYIKNNKKVVIK